ncbi:MAG TPA: nucleotidyltransferase family protein [Bacteroidales bacterium]|nr:nucleotidyltransferase family protein [Bacteroidales bacterium]
MIFAAGKGTRLGTLTESIPKALVDINGKSALRIAVERCYMHGFNDILVNVHHFADMVEDEAEKLRKSGYSITISDERDKLLETGGGLFKAKDFFDDKPFLLYNADIITDLDLTSLYEFHHEKKGLATLAVRHRKGNRFLLVDQDGLLKGWRNNATGEEILISKKNGQLSETGFSGIHVVEPRIFKFMNEGVYTMTTLYLRLAKGHKIYTYTYDKGYWGDIGTPENLEYAREISKLPE